MIINKIRKSNFEIINKEIPSKTNFGCNILFSKKMNILIFGSEGNIGDSLVKNFLKKTKGNIYIVDVNRKSVHKNERIKYLSLIIKDSIKL